MRVAFLSDIHGNAVALEAVLADIRAKRIDQLVVLGDIAYRGPQPKRAVELVRGLDARVLQGNADLWTVRGVRRGEVPDTAWEMMNRERQWTVERLDPDDLDYLQGLPTEWVIPLSGTLKAHAFHATPDDLFEVVLPDAPPAVLRQKLMKRPDVSLYVYAHIHLPYVRYMDGKCLVNIGSVGLPFDGLPQASYAIVEAEENRFSVTIERVPFDVERVAAEYEAGGYPNLQTMRKVVRQAVSPFSL